MNRLRTALAAVVLCVTSIGGGTTAGSAAERCAAGSTTAPSRAAGVRCPIRIGTTVRGRPIIVERRVGAGPITRTVLVVGSIHGDERQGERVADRLAFMQIPAGLELLVIRQANPDGAALGRRGNANGVDLNRNFPTNWQAPGGTHTSGLKNSGPRPASEPETRALIAYIRGAQPDVTVWFHQPWGEVDCDTTRVAACRQYAKTVGMPIGFAVRPGTATDWQMTAVGGQAFVVEFPAGGASASDIDRHARAVLGL